MSRVHAVTYDPDVTETGKPVTRANWQTGPHASRVAKEYEYLRRLAAMPGIIGIERRDGAWVRCTGSGALLDNGRTDGKAGRTQRTMWPERAGMPRFDVFGRYVLDVRRVEGRWVAFRVGEGTRHPVNLHVPSDLGDTELDRYLEDLLHESARPGTSLRRMP